MENETHFHSQLEQVKADLLKMAGLAEAAIDLSLRALLTRDEVAACRVISNDDRIDQLENDLHDRCITLLATQQPVAVDLRLLTSVMRISASLERMGDQAVNLAQRALTLEDLQPMDFPAELQIMGDKARAMVSDSLDAFIDRNVDLANQVRCRDDEVDELCQDILEMMITRMMGQDRINRRGVEIILAARHLERVGDEATNVCEEVVYLVEGKVVRHGGINDCVAENGG